MDYEINNETLYICSLGDKKSKIYESNNEYEVNLNTSKVIEHSCEYFGSTMEGRQLGTKALIGVTHKSPIYIEESSNIIFFPLNSPRNENCSWVSFNNILSYKQGKDQKSTIIKFKNGKELEVLASIGTVTNQILRSSRLQVVLNDRKQRI